MLLIIDNNCVAGQKYYRAAPLLWLVRLNGIIAERFYRRVSVLMHKNARKIEINRQFRGALCILDNTSKNIFIAGLDCFCNMAIS